MKRIKFYICPACGNIVTSAHESNITCCGKVLTQLKAKPADEVHFLNVENVEDDYYITFPHEMTKEHYLTFLAYVCSDRVLLIHLYPEQSGEVRFPKMYGGKFYFGCNKHGLWVSK